MKRIAALAMLLALEFPITGVASEETPAPSPSPSASAVPSASPAPYGLTPPDGWVKRDVTMSLSGATILGMWMSPVAGVTGENINLGRQVAPNLTLEKYAEINRDALKKVVGAENMHEFHAEKLCNGSQDGWFSSSTMAFGQKAMLIEQTLVLAKGVAYIATYTRLNGVSENADARKALDSLCTT